MSDNYSDSEMSDLDEVEIIDLTNSPYYNPGLNCRMSWKIGISFYEDSIEVIDLVNDSRCDETNTLTDAARTDKTKSKKQEGNPTNKTGKNKALKSKKFGNCPICRHKLGSKPLASTKCGHVFCLPCLEVSLKFNKICPTCRCQIKGKSDFHPLYLDLN